MSLLTLLRTLVGAPITPVVPPVYGEPSDTRSLSAAVRRIAATPALDGSTRIGGIPVLSDAHGIGKSGT